MRARLGIVCLLTLTAVGCAPGSYYHWGSYDNSLYQHYKSPQDRESWIEGLKTTILDAEQKGEKVPPGLYGEYGYALFEEGDSKQAISYFQKERDLWPESRFLMEKMIRNAERRGKPASPSKGPASNLEKRS
jgi:hypothetical protein